MCKGTDFPGLLGPIENIQQPARPESQPSKPEAAAASAPAAEAASSEEGQGKGGDEGGSKDGSPGDGGAKGGEDEEDEDAKRKRLEEEENAKKKEEEEERRRLIKAGAWALSGVLGEEVAANVREWRAEWWGEQGSQRGEWSGFSWRRRCFLLGWCPRGQSAMRVVIG